ncbi:MAG: pentapeptide repeat-containing protein [Gammaproteobacteria bacterium]|nr:pentapeptide repeat-containing protein [Gammaproteobacteria bacterium]
MAQTPEIKKDEMYRMLRGGEMEEFNQRLASGEKPDLTNCDFRNVDLQGMDAGELAFTNSYFRQADLRGVDFSKCDMHGASIHGAKISGVFFPPTIDPYEIFMSYQYGIRLRYK